MSLLSLKIKAKSIRFLGHIEACWVIAEIIWTLTHTKKLLGQGIHPTVDDCCHRNLANLQLQALTSLDSWINQPTILTSRTKHKCKGPLTQDKVYNEQYEKCECTRLNL